VTLSRLALKLLPELATVRSRGDRRRELVVGAGRRGRSVVRELREDGVQVAGFVDDNVALRRRRVGGVTVVGATDEMAVLLAATGPQEVLVTIPDAPQERLLEVVRACEEAGIPCRFVHRRTETQAPLVEVAAE
jgi:FlaA1/EpsC-like NDP-sugar epimerase